MGSYGFKKKTPVQLQSLERFYSEEKYPKQNEITKYARSLDLTYNQVRIWFKERRRKERKETDESNHCFENHAPKISNSERMKVSSLGKRRVVRFQVLYPKEYILRKVFRKDGPPLGSEFDSPALFKSSNYRKDNGKICDNTFSGNQRIMKKRKSMDPPLEASRTLTVPANKKHGMGKGLMTIWNATNSHKGEFPIDLDSYLNQNLSFNSSILSADSTEKSPHGSKNENLVSKQRSAHKKLEKKKKPLPAKRKIPSKRVVKPKIKKPTECMLSAGGTDSSENQVDQSTLVDDEELELRELQAGPNPLRCSAHLDSNGMHCCPLCKDLLGRFPPQNVKMKQLFSARPWDSSPELVKKLFKVVRFLYTHSIRIDVNPFTVDELAQSFHDKDSMLLGEIHVALLKLLLLDVEKGEIDDFVPLSTKDCRFLSFLNFIREQELDVHFLIKSLNPVTWIEILRQVLVAAGLGSKNSYSRRDQFNKDKNQMVKYGLRPRTLKGELFALLSKRGIGGLKVSELAKSPQIVELDLPNPIEEIEQLIYTTLSSDITLFEKIGPSVYRLRVDPRIKGENPNSDSEGSGSVDNDDSSDDSSTSNSSDDELDCSNEINLAKNGRKVIKYKEIDESYCGEAWVLGLMEGEYFDLSIEEKLDALVALVDLAGGAGSSLRLEGPAREISANPNAHLLHHGSGAKIKKSTYALLRSNASNTAQSAPDSSGSLTGGSSDNDSGHKLQSVHLGSDRRYNNYWLFLGPCTGEDPGHRRVYFESSEDGHWEVIDTPQDLLALLSILDTRGIRESGLFNSMEKRHSLLCQAMESHLKSQEDDLVSLETNSSQLDSSTGEGSSPISDIDNTTLPVGPTNNNSINNSNNSNSLLNPPGAIVLETGRTGEERRQRWERSQAYDKWVWDSFYSALNAVRFSKRSFIEKWVRCSTCHDLYWRDEKHCRVCHTTFELDFDLEERYAVHSATCREMEGSCEFPVHKVLSSQLQALKAAVHAIEAAMPEIALAGSWMKSAHKLWVKRLRRTSSLPELLQVLVDFVGAINEDWLCQSASSAIGSNSNSSVDDVIVSFQTMPQTASAVALWIVKLDSLVAPYLESRSNAEKPATLVGPAPTRKRLVRGR